MNIQALSVALLLMILALACSESGPAGTDGLEDPGQSDASETEICIIERQCFVDPFAPADYDATVEERLDAMTDYLESLDLPVFDLRLEEDYFEAVCEACAVCPSGDRFVVRTEEGAREKLLADNIWLMDCGAQTQGAPRVIYHETKCADPWAEHWQEEGYQTPDEKKERVSAFLLENGVDVFQIQMEEDQAYYCEACVCRSGNKFTLEIDPDDLQTALALGFEKDE